LAPDTSVSWHVMSAAYLSIESTEYMNAYCESLHARSSPCRLEAGVEFLCGLMSFLYSCFSTGSLAFCQAENTILRSSGL
jgi:hypothetical protein